MAEWFARNRERLLQHLLRLDDLLDEAEMHRFLGIDEAA